MKLAVRNGTQERRPGRLRLAPAERGVGFAGRGTENVWPARRHQVAPFLSPKQPSGSGSRVSRTALVPRQRIQAYCQAVAREFHRERIVLFGSYAYGQPTPDSDVDLLVVLPFRGNDVAKAIQIRARFDTPFPLDLLVRKPEFVTARLQERDMFIELVMTQGLVIAARTTRTGMAAKRRENAQRSERRNAVPSNICNGPADADPTLRSIADGRFHVADALPRSPINSSGSVKSLRPPPSALPTPHFANPWFPFFAFP